MRTSLSSLALLLAVACNSGACVADELFSKVGLDSVFTSSQSASPDSAGPRQSTPRQLLELGQTMDATSLVELLKKAGIEAQKMSASLVAFQLRHGDKASMVEITIAPTERRLDFVMLLAELAEGAELPGDKLLGLMSASVEHAPRFFAYNKATRRLELRHSSKSDGIDAEILSRELAQLKTAADKTTDLWQIASAKTPAPTEKPANSTFVGSWSASKSTTEAFALRLTAEGTFNLVHVNGTKVSRAKGNFTLTDQLLTLNGDDGTRLAGKVLNPTASEFSFRLEKAAADSPSLTFKRVP